MTDKPIAAAIKGLLDASGWTDEEWGTFLHIPRWNLEQLKKYRNGEVYPSDDRMSLILSACNRINGARSSCPDMPKALDVFWDAIEATERGDNCEIPCEVHAETVSQRLTRFTNANWLDNVRRNIHLIPPRDREKFLEAVVRLFNQFVPPE